jgi:hypothetical protein
MAAFASVAAGIGMAISAGSAGMSFIAAGKAKDEQRKAEAKADLAMQDARKALETNFYAQQAIKKEPYELERESLLSAGAQAVEAGVESERGAAATAGKVQMAMNEGQAGIRTAQGREMTDLENKQLAEQSRLRDVGVQLDLGEVSGAQQAAANNQQIAAQQTTQGIQGIANVAQQALTTLVPLYSKTASANATNDAISNATKSGFTKDQMVTSLNQAGIKISNPNQLQDVIGQQTPEMIKSINQMFQAPPPNRTILPSGIPRIATPISKFSDLPYGFGE